MSPGIRFLSFLWISSLCLVYFGHSPANAQQNQQRAASGPKNGSGSGLGNYTQPPSACDIPTHEFDMILSRPTDRSVELCVLQNRSGRGQVRYRVMNGQDWQQTREIEVNHGAPVRIVLGPLQADTQYIYQWVFTNLDTNQQSRSDEYSFHTARAPGSTFAFTVTADSHLDENSSGAVYARTLQNALADRPDFHLELGDTFMTGKYVQPELAKGHYLAQRYYLAQLCSSAPLFFVMGNHDGEAGGRGSIAWATTTRKSLFPNPAPNHFYSGNREPEPGIGLPENYYAWHWGDAQFIVLDPYRYTSGKRRGGKQVRTEQGQPASTAVSQSNWYWTLGEAQYRWLQAELAKPSKYRFVFIHHLVGGAIANQRGGVEVASLWEWGGKNEAGEYEFDQFRREWDKPIHSMLVDAGVSIVFHGHDHFFAKQELDGIIYQEVPQPSHARVGNTRVAAEYGYLAGDFQPSSGFVRVRVQPQEVRVDYVRTFVENVSAGRNGEVTYSYVVQPK